VPGRFQQQRVNPAGLHPGGVLVAGAAADPPWLRARHSPGRRRPSALAAARAFPAPGGEGRDPVVVQEPGELEDLGDAGDAEVTTVQGRRELGPGDHVPGLVAGEHDSQRAADLGDDPVIPAAAAARFRAMRLA
jgi:hypothetical protein